MLFSSTPFFFLLCLICLTSCHVNGDSLVMTVAYCPTPFSSAGALVEIDPLTGDYSVSETFEWPDDLAFGCAALLDPTVTSDQERGILALEFIDDFGAVLSLDLDNAKQLAEASPTDEFFHGFVSMLPFQQNYLIGVAPTVEEESSPYCSDGCYNFAQLDAVSGRYMNISDVPFKEAADDVALLHNGSFFTQMGYDLREPSERCAPEDFDDCLVQIDSKTGALLAAKYTPYQIYQFAPNSVQDDGTVLTWMFGDFDLCPKNESYLFARVNLASAKATPVGCVPRNLIVDWDEWIGSFSLDSSLFATASGNSEGDPSQLLVFNTTTGDVVVESKLEDLPKELGAWSDLIFIWAIDFIKN